MTCRFRHPSLRRTFLFCVIVGIFFISLSLSASRFSVVTDSYVYFISDDSKRPVQLYGYNIHTKEQFSYNITTTLPIKGLVANNEVVCVWTEKFLVLSRHEKTSWESQYTFSGTDTTLKDVVVHGSKAYFVADTLYALSPDKDLSKSYFSINQDIPQIIVHQGRGYMVSSQNGYQLYEINLKTLEIDKACTFERNIKEFYISDGKGYVLNSLSNTGLLALHTIDLKSFTEIACISLSFYVEKVCFQEPFAYVVDRNTIELIHLKTKRICASLDATYLSVHHFYPCGFIAYIVTRGENLICLDLIHNTLNYLLTDVDEFHPFGGYGYVLQKDKPDISVVLLKAGRLCGTFKNEPGQQIAVTKKGLFSPKGYLTNLWVPPFIPEHALPLLHDRPSSITFDWKLAAKAEVKCDALINWIYAEEDPQYFYLFAQTAYADGKAATKDLIKALEVNDPDARCFMYLAFRDGLWGAPKSETLALFYKDSSDE